MTAGFTADLVGAWILLGLVAGVAEAIPFFGFALGLFAGVDFAASGLVVFLAALGCLAGAAFLLAVFGTGLAAEVVFLEPDWAGTDFAFVIGLEAGLGDAADFFFAPALLAVFDLGLATFLAEVVPFLGALLAGLAVFRLLLSVFLRAADNFETPRQAAQLISPRMGWRTNHHSYSQYARARWNF